VPPGQKVINGAVTAHGRASKDENTCFAFMNANIGGTGMLKEDMIGFDWRFVLIVIDRRCDYFRTRKIRRIYLLFY